MYDVRPSRAEPQSVEIKPALVLVNLKTLDIKHLHHQLKNTSIQDIMEQKSSSNINIRSVKPGDQGKSQQREQGREEPEIVSELSTAEVTRLEEEERKDRKAHESELKEHAQKEVEALRKGAGDLMEESQ